MTAPSELYTTVMTSMTLLIGIFVGFVLAAVWFDGRGRR